MRFSREFTKAIAGAIVMLIGIIIMTWTIISWSTMFVGHAIREDHELIIRKIYSRIRHPMYFSALLFWSGLSVVTLNPFTVTFLDVNLPHFKFRVENPHYFFAVYLLQRFIAQTDRDRIRIFSYDRSVDD